MNDKDETTWMEGGNDWVPHWQEDVKTTDKYTISSCAHVYSLAWQREFENLREVEDESLS